MNFELYLCYVIDIGTGFPRPCENFQAGKISFESLQPFPMVRFNEDRHSESKNERWESQDIHGGWVVGLSVEGLSG